MCDNPKSYILAYSSFPAFAMSGQHIKEDMPRMYVSRVEEGPWDFSNRILGM